MASYAQGYLASATVYSGSGSIYVGTSSSPSSASVTVASGGTVYYKAVPSTGYYLSKVYYAKNSSSSSVTVLTGSDASTYQTTYTGSFTMPSSAITLYVVFAKRSYTVSTSAGTGGTAYVGSSSSAVTSTSQSFTYGNTVYYKVTPSTGYYISSIYYTNSSGTKTTILTGSNSDSYTSAYSGSFTLPASAVTLYATFTKRTYTGSVGSVSNGTLTLSPTSYNYQTTLTFKATPTEGYYVAKIYYTNSSGSTVSVCTGSSSYDYSNPLSCTLSAPTSNITAYATFTNKSYTVTAGTSSYGSIYVGTSSSPSTTSASIAYKGTAYYRVVPNDGYYVKTITYSGDKSATLLSSGSDASAYWTKYASSFTMPAGSITVNATFNARSYTVTAGTGSGGSIYVGNSFGTTPSSSSVSVTYGNKAHYRIVPSTGYYISSISYKTLGGSTTTLYSTSTCGDESPWQDTYRDSVAIPSDSITINATFAKRSYTVSTSLTPSDSGSISPSSKSGVVYQSSNTYVITPNEGYYISAIYYKLSGDTATRYQEVTGSDKSLYWNAYSYTIASQPAANITVYAELSPRSYKVTLGSVSNATASVSATSVDYLDQFTFTVDPDDYYQIEKVYYIDDESVETVISKSVASGGAIEYKIDMPHSDITVYADVLPMYYNLSYFNMGSDCKDCAVTGPSSARYLSTVELEATAVAGYEPYSMTITNVGTLYEEDFYEATYNELWTTEFTMYHADQSVMYTFVKRFYQVNYTVEDTDSKSDGAVEGSGGSDTFRTDEADVDSAEYASTVNLKMTADEGYSLVGLTVDGESLDYESDGDFEYSWSASFTVAAEDPDIVASFDINKHSITLVEVPGGTVSFVGDVDASSVEYGTRVYLSFTQNDGYTLTGAEIVTPTGHFTVTPTFTSSTLASFVMPDEDVTITPTYKATEYDIVYSPSDYGAFIDTSDYDSAATDVVVPIKVQPIDGYALKSLLVQGEAIEVSTEDSLVYTGSFSMPANNVTVRAIFEIRSYKVVASTGGNGTVSVSPEYAEYETQITVTAVADSGYILSSLMIDEEDYNDGEHEISSSFDSTTYQTTYKTKFYMPATGDVSVVATYERNKYSIATDEVEGGTLGIVDGVADADGYVTFGDSVYVAIELANGYTLDSVMAITAEGEHIAVVKLGDSYYGFTMPASSVTVSAAIRASSYTISYYSTNTAYGTIVGDSVPTATTGTTVTVTMTPTEGYELISLVLNETEVSLSSVDEIETEEDGLYYTYSFTMPGGVTTVYASFGARVYKVTYDDEMLNGTVTGVDSAAYGDSVILVATPNSGYELSVLSITDTDGNPVTLNENSFFYMPIGGVYVTATFVGVSSNLYLYATPSDYGTLYNSTGSSMAAYGDTVTIIAQAEEGRELTSLTISSGEVTFAESTDDDSTGYYYVKFVMPAEAVSLYANFGTRSYTLSYAAGSNGSVSGSKAEADYEEEVTVTAVADEGYELESFTVGGAELTSSDYTATKNSDGTTTYSYTFKMPASNLKVEATFKVCSYTVTLADVSSGGSITFTMLGEEGDTQVEVEYGTVVYVSLETEDGYSLTDLAATLEDGSEVTVMRKNKATAYFTMPAGNVTVTASFTEGAYDIYVEADAGLVVDVPSGAATDELVEFTVTAEDGYELSSVKLTTTSGTSTLEPDENGVYSFTMPSSSVTIYVTGTQNSYSVTCSASPETAGSITCTAEAESEDGKYGAGTAITVTVTANAGWELSQLDVDGSGTAFEESEEGGTYTATVNVPANDLEIVANFTGVQYKITYETPVGGTISGLTKANTGDEITVYLSEDEGYSIPSENAITVMLDDAADEGYEGESVTCSSRQCTFTMPSGNVTVSANFTAGSYSISSTIEGVYDEEITVVSVQETAYVGEEVTVTVTGAKGYSLSSLFYNGTKIKFTTNTDSEGNALEDDGETDTYTGTFTMPASDVGIVATFALESYTVTYEALDGGTAKGAKTASFGTEVTVSVSVNEGWSIDDAGIVVTENTEAAATVDPLESETSGIYAFVMPDTSVVVTGAFKRNTYAISYATSDVTGESEAEYEAEVTVTANAKEGYTLAGVSVADADGNAVEVSEGVANGEGSYSYTFTMPASKVTVAGVYTALQYEVSYSWTPEVGGTVTGPTSVDYGSEVTFYMTPASGYEVSSVSVGGKTYSAVESEDDGIYECTFTMASTETVEVVVGFAGKTYSIEVDSYISGGKVTYSGNTYTGNTITLTATPGTGYALSSLTATDVDGNKLELSEGVENDDGAWTYTFEMPANDVIIFATFKAYTYTIEYSYGEGGIAYGVTTANYGDTITVILSTEDAYTPKLLTHNGTDVTSQVSNTATNTYEYKFVMTTASATIYAEFEPGSYAVEYVYDTGKGKVATVSSETKFEYRTNVEFTVVADSGYSIDSVYVVDANGKLADTTVTTETDSLGEYTFEMPSSTAYIHVTFSTNTYTVTYTSGTGGSASGTEALLYLETAEFSLYPDSGYYLTALEVDGSLVNLSTDANFAKNSDSSVYSYSFTMPHHDVVVTPTFSTKKYEVTYEYDSDRGSVSGSNSPADYLSTFKVVAAPNTGYYVADHYPTAANGTQIQVTDADELNYSFEMPYSNVVFTVEYEPITYEVTYVSGDGGTVSGVSYVDYKDELTITAKPDSGYSLSKLTIAGEEVDLESLTANDDGTLTYTLEMPAQNIKVVGSFSAIKYLVTYEYDEAGGTVQSSTGSDSASYGSTFAFVAVAGTGHTLQTITAADVNDSALTVSGASGVYSFTMPARDAKVSVTFVANTYTITYAGVTGGTVSGVTEADYGSSVTVTATPSEGYEFATLYVNGSEVTATDDDGDGVYTYTFDMPNSTVTVSATFGGKEYSITYDDSVEGTFSGSASANTDDKVTFTVASNEGYTLAGVSGTYGACTEADGSDCETLEIYSSSGSYYFTMPAANVNITAEFAESGTVYEIVTEPADGTNIVVASAATAGESVTFSISVEDGHDLTSVVITKNGEEAVEESSSSEEEVGSSSSEETGDEAGTTDETDTDDTDTDETNSDDTATDETTDGTADGTDTEDGTSDEAGDSDEGTTEGTDDADDTETSSTEVVWVQNEDGSYTFTMPAVGVTITTTSVGSTVQVACNTNDYGILQCGDNEEENATSAEAGTILNLTATTTAEGYALGSLTINGTAVTTTEAEGENDALVYTYALTVPAEDVEILATFVPRNYEVTYEYDESMVVLSGATSVAFANDLTIMLNAKDGYQIDSVKVSYGEDNVETLTGSSGVYTYNMPSSDITVAIYTSSTSYDIVYTEPTGGTITVTNSSGIEITNSPYGETVVVTLRESLGYSYSSFYINGVGATEFCGTDYEEVLYNDGTYAYVCTFTMPSTYVTITGSFVANDYTVAGAVDPEDAGTITVTGSSEVDGTAYAKTDEIVNVKTTTATGYTLSGVTVSYIISSDTSCNDANYVAQDGVSLEEGCSDLLINTERGTAKVTTISDVEYEFTMPAGPTTVTASYTANTYSIYQESDANGSLNVAKKGSYKETISVNVFTNSGYEVDALTYSYEDESGETVTMNVTFNSEDSTWSFVMPAGDVDLVLTTKAAPYTVTAVVDPSDAGSVTLTSGSNGPDTEIEANTDEDVTITVTTNAGYSISGVTATYSYATATTDASTDEESTDEADDEESSEDGSTDEESTDESTDTSTDEDATDEDDGVSNAKVATISSGVYEFTMPAADVTVTVSFTANTYSIYTSSDSHGSLTVANKGTYNTQVTVAVETDDGYSVSSLTYTYEDENGETQSVNVTDKDDEGNYVFTMPAGDVTLKLVTGEKQYAVTAVASPEAGGTISLDGVTADDDGNVTAATGATVTVTPAAANGYSVGKVSVSYADDDGNELGTAKVATADDGGYEFAMPAGNATVTVTFTENSYTIYAEAGVNGSLTVANKGTFGSSISVGVSVDDGYKIESLTYSYTDTDGEEHTGVEITADSDGNYSFTMPDGDVTITLVTVEGSYKVYTVASPEIGGSITLSGTTTETDDDGTEYEVAATGSAITVTAEANSGYSISGASVTYANDDGETIGTAKVTTEGSGVYSFTMPAGNATVTVTYSSGTYMIYTEADDNGRMTVASSASYGESVPVTLYLDDGYGVGSLTYSYEDESGNTQTVNVTNDEGTYSFTMPAGDVTLTLVTAPSSYTVSAANSPSEGGVATLTTESVTEGAAEIEASTGEVVYVTVAAAEHYEFAGLDVSYSVTEVVEETDDSGATTETEVTNTMSVKTTTVDAASGLYKFTMPAASVSVTANYTAETHNIYTETENGGLSVATSASYGDEVSFTATALDGYGITSLTYSYYEGETLVKSDELTAGDDGSYSFTMPGADVTITLVAEAKTYKITSVTVDPESAGTVAVSTEDCENALDCDIPLGEVVSVSTAANDGYEVSGLTVAYVSDENVKAYGKAATTGEGTYEFEMPAGTVTLTATYTGKPYFIYLEEDEHGSVTAGNKANYGSEVTFTVALDDGYSVSSLTYSYYEGETLVKSDELELTTETTEVEGGEAQTESYYAFTMPKADVTITLVTSAETYTVSAVVDPESFGSITVANSTESAAATTTAYTGETVTVSFTESTSDVREGYSFAGIIVSYATGDCEGDDCETTTASDDETSVVDVTTLDAASGSYEFEMPAGDIVVTAKYLGDVYLISYEESDGGTATGSDTARYESEVTLTTTVNEGYESVTPVVTAYDAYGNASVTVEVTDNGDGTWTFTMPLANVVVSLEAVGGTYTVTCDTDVSGGSLTCPETGTATTGEEVEIGYSADGNYVLASLTVTTVIDETEDESGDVTCSEGELTADYEGATVCLSEVGATLYSDASGNTFTLTSSTDEDGTTTYTAWLYSGEVTADESSETTCSEGEIAAVYSDDETITVCLNSEGVALYSDASGNIYTVSSTTDADGATTYTATLYSAAATEVEVAVNVPTYESENGYSFTMPSANVYVTATFLDQRDALTISTETEGGVKVSAPSYAAAEGEVTFTLELEDGYELSSVTVTDKSGNEVSYSVSSDTYTFTMPGEAVTIKAVATVLSYTLASSLDDGLSITAYVDGTEVGNEDAGSDSDGDSEGEDSEEDSDDDESSADISVSVAYGSTVSFTLTAEDQYSVETVRISDYSGNWVSYTETDGTYSFTMPASDVTITVTATANTYKIVKEAAEGSTISLSSSNGSGSFDAGAVAYGDEISVTVYAETGYTVTSVSVTDEDGNELLESAGTSVGTYSFTMPASTVTIKTETAAATYTIAQSLGAGVSIESITVRETEDSDAVDYSEETGVGAGSIVSFTFGDPETGYELGAVSVTKVENSAAVQYELSSGVYTFTMPSANVSINTEEALATYKIATNAASGTEIEVDVDDLGAVEFGTKVSFTATADDGYTVTGVTATYEGSESPLVSEVAEDGSYSFEMPAADVTIATSVSEATYAVKTSTLGAGVTATITLADGTTYTATSSTETEILAAYGSTVSFTLAAGAGYGVGTLNLADELNKPIAYTLVDGTYSFTMPAYNVYIGTADEIETYKLTLDEGEGSTIEVSVSDVGAVEYGTEITFTVETDDGYAFSGVTISYDGGTITPTETEGIYAFTMPNADVTIKTTVSAEAYEIASDLGTGLEIAIKVDGDDYDSETGAAYGSEVTFEITIADYTTLGTVSIVDGNNKAVKFSLQDGVYSFTMPAASVEITATSSTETYKIASEPADGSTIDVSVEDEGAVEVGTTVSFSATAESGYTVTSVLAKAEDETELVNGTEAGDYNFTMPGSNVTITTEVGKASYYIDTESLSEGVSVVAKVDGEEVAADAAVPYLSAVELYFSVEDGYELGTVSLINGTTNAAVPYTYSEDESGDYVCVYAFTMPAASVTVSNSGSNSTYKIATESVDGATITLDVEDAGAVAYGTNVGVTIDVEEGYVLSSYTVSSNSSGTLAGGDQDEFTFTMPASDVTIAVSLEYDSYEIATNLSSGVTPTISVGGYAYDSEEGAAYMSEVSVSFALESGYELGEVSFTNLSTGKMIPYTLSGGVYTFTMPAADVSISNVGENSTYTIATSPATGSSIEVDVDDMGAVEYGSLVSFTTYSTNIYTSVGSVSAAYVDASGNTQQVTLMSCSEGESKDEEADEEAETEEAEEAESTCTALEDASGSGTYYFTMPAGNVTLYTETSMSPFTIATDLGAGIGLTSEDGGEVATEAEYGSSVSFMVTVESGYAQGTVSIETDDVSVPYSYSDGVYTFTMPADEVTIYVTSTNNIYGVTTRATGATITLDVEDADNVSFDETVSFTVAAEDGYTVSTVTVTDRSGNVLALYDADGEEVEGSVGSEDGSYSFKMPASNATVTVVATTNSYEISKNIAGGIEITVADAANYLETVSFSLEITDEAYGIGEITVQNLTTLEYLTISQTYGKSEYTFTMPAAPVEITVLNTFSEFDIVVSTTTGVSVNVADVANYQDEVGFTVEIDRGYELSMLVITDASSNDVPASCNEDSTTCSFTMPASDVTLQVAAEPLPYTVSYEVTKYADYGTVSLNGNETAVTETEAVTASTVSVTTTTATGFSVSSVTVLWDEDEDGEFETSVEVAGEGNDYSFTMPAGNARVYVEFDARYYAITYAEVTGGTLSGATSSYAGNVITVTATEAAGYSLQAIVIAGDTVTSFTDAGDGSYTTEFTMPTTSVTVSAVFAERTYEVAVEAGTGGSLSVTPLDEDGNAVYGTSMTVTASPEIGFSLTSITAVWTDDDGEESEVTLSGADGTYTFTMPAGNVTITATFTEGAYAIWVAAAAGTTIDAPSGSVAGEEVNFTLALESGYDLDSVRVTYNDSTFIAATVTTNADTVIVVNKVDCELSDGVYGFTMPEKNVTITSYTKANTYSVTYSVNNSAMGSVTEDVTEADKGETVKFAVSVEEGYKLSSVTVTIDASGTSVAVNDLGSGEYSFEMPAGDVTVNVKFVGEDEEGEVYVITYADVVGGTVSGVESAAYGATVTIYVSEDDGCTFSRPTVVSDDGDTLSLTKLTTRSFTFEMPFSNVTVIGNFVAEGSYTITYAVVTGGDAEGVRSANAGDSVSLIVTPTKGYILSTLYVGDEKLDFEEEDDGTYTAVFVMPAKAVVVIPTFVVNVYTISYYASGSGTVTGDTSATVGDTVLVTATAEDGYVLSLLNISGSSVEFAVDETDTNIYTASFVMPASVVSVIATFYNTVVVIPTDTTTTDTTTTDTTTTDTTTTDTTTTDTTTTDTTGTVDTDTTYVTVNSYEITYAEVSNGTLSGDASAVVGGSAVVVATASSGYMLKSLTITDEDGNAIDYSGASGVYYFTMPSSAVSVTGSFVSAVSVTGAADLDSNLAILVTNDYDTTAAVYGNVISITSDTSKVAIASVNFSNAGQSTISTQNGVLRIYSASAVEVRVYTLKGALVKAQRVSSGESFIKGINSGVYMVRISDGTVGKVSIR